MKSIGETLREARDAKGVTVKQVSQDINISREFLSALEDENFEIFPAETYLLGFLRNYSEYLGLDSEKTITLYKNYKIGEEPAPLAELVGPRRQGPDVPTRLIVIILLLAILGAGGFFGVKVFLTDRPVKSVEAPARKTVQYRLDENEAQWTIQDGDEILIAYEQGELHMVVSVQSNSITIQPAGGGNGLSLSAGDEKILPGGDGIPVIGFRLNSIGTEGALLTVQRTDVSVAREESVASAPAVLPVVEGSRKILLGGRTKPEDFTLNALFSGYCLFRYQADKDERVEKFYRDGDRIRLDVSDSLLIGYSSGGDVTIKISGVSVVHGKTGEVAVYFIQWVKNDEGKYDLVLFPVQ